MLLGYTGELEKISLPCPPTVEIPVCYGNEYGPDLADLAATHGISPERVVELHCGAQYIVYFVGFVPGFAYLGGLPPELATPRLDKPRQRVPVGSVAIGGDQTGVYPMETPGGWRIIGATPMAIFDRSLPNLSRLSIGNRVRFKPISSGPVFRPAKDARNDSGAIAPGLFTTVQDLGRFGYGPLGVSPSGAADLMALRLGNAGGESGKCPGA